MNEDWVTTLCIEVCDDEIIDEMLESVEVAICVLCATENLISSVVKKFNKRFVRGIFVKLEDDAGSESGIGVDAGSIRRKSTEYVLFHTLP